MTQVIKNKKGVTLVELLAVVVILGIIAAIAVPTIGGLISRQRQRAAEATYDTIVEASKLYAQDVTGRFTLEALETNDFIDLKSNTFSYGPDADNLTDADKDEIFVEVSGNNVTFFTVSTGGTAVVLWINGYKVN